MITTVTSDRTPRPGAGQRGRRRTGATSSVDVALDMECLSTTRATVTRSPEGVSGTRAKRSAHRSPLATPLVAASVPEHVRLPGICAVGPGRVRWVRTPLCPGEGQHDQTDQQQAAQ